MTYAVTSQHHKDQGTCIEWVAFNLHYFASSGVSWEILGHHRSDTRFSPLHWLGFAWLGFAWLGLLGHEAESRNQLKRERWLGRTCSSVQMNLLSLRNNRLTFKTLGKLSIILEEFIDYTPLLIRENWRMSTCNRLDLQTLGSQPIMSKKFPDHWAER